MGGGESLKVLKSEVEDFVKRNAEAGSRKRLCLTRLLMMGEHRERLERRERMESRKRLRLTRLVGNKECRKKKGDWGIGGLGLMGRG